MKCPICGNRNRSGTKFCIQCGHKLEGAASDNPFTHKQGEKRSCRVNNREYDIDKEYEVKRKDGLGIVKTMVIFIVAFLVIGTAGVITWNSGILSGKTDSSNNHYNKNLGKNSDLGDEKSKEAEETTLDDWTTLENEDAIEDFEAESDTMQSTLSTTEVTQAATGSPVNQGDVNANGSKEITLAGVATSNVPDYSKYLSPDNYEKLTVDDNFSFSYPSGFFSKVEQYNKNYTFSTSDNSDTLYISCEPGSGDAVKDVRDAANKNKSLINAIEDKHGVLVVSDKVKEGWAHCIVGGNYTEGQNGNGNGMYKVIVSNGFSIYTLDYEYGSSDSTQYYTAQNYMFECMYRYCEHSGTTYKPRTWQEFSKDQMGEKKDD